jgi:hypothetical protein
LIESSKGKKNKVNKRAVFFEKPQNKENRDGNPQPFLSELKQQCHAQYKK